MPLARTFEELTVWQDARALVVDIYKDFGPGTPGGYDFRFKGQVQDAGVSIMNISKAIANLAKHVRISIQ